MSEQEIRGKVKNLTGRAKEAAGVITGDMDLENEGAAQRAEGALEEGIGKARRKVGEAIEDLGEKLKK